MGLGEHRFDLVTRDRIVRGPVARHVAQHEQAGALRAHPGLHAHNDIVESGVKQVGAQLVADLRFLERRRCGIEEAPGALPASGLDGDETPVAVDQEQTATRFEDASELGERGLDIRNVLEDVLAGRSPR